MLRVSEGRSTIVAVRRFATVSEVEALESFRRDNPLCKEKFSSVIGDYDFDEPVGCCVQNPSGNLCRERHKRGWVALLNDGTSTYLGGRCAKSKFDADTVLRKSIATYQNAARRRTRLNRLYELHAERSQRVAAARRSDELLSAIRERVEQSVVGLGPKILGRLRHSAAMGTTPVYADLISVKKYIDEDGSPQQERTVVLRVIGTLAGLGLLTEGPYLSTRAMIRKVVNAFAQVELLGDRAKTSEIEALAAQMDSQSQVDIRLNELEDLESQFERNDWSLLWLLSSDHGEQKKAARFALAKSGEGAGLDRIKSWLSAEGRRHAIAHGADRIALK